MSSLENIVSKIQNVGLKGSLNIYSWFTGIGSNKVATIEAQSIPMEEGNRPQLPENFELKMLESFSNRRWRNTLAVTGK